MQELHLEAKESQAQVLTCHSTIPLRLRQLLEADITLLQLPIILTQTLRAQPESEEKLKFAAARLSMTMV